MQCKQMLDEDTIVKCDECEIKESQRNMWRSKKYNTILCDKHMNIRIQKAEKEYKEKLLNINNPFKWLITKLSNNNKLDSILNDFYKGDSCVSITIS